jgi:hypothetical protein
MSYTIDYIIAKANLMHVIEHLKVVNAKISEKNPSHEWIAKHNELMLSLTDSYGFILDADKELINLRSQNFSYLKLFLELNLKIEKLEKENKDLREML